MKKIILSCAIFAMSFTANATEDGVGILACSFYVHQVVIEGKLYKTVGFYADDINQDRKADKGIVAVNEETGEVIKRGESSIKLDSLTVKSSGLSCE